MRKIGLVVLVLALGVGVALAGTSGLTNKVTSSTQPGTGDSSLQVKVRDFQDDVVTKLDAMTTTDGLEPENLNSGEMPSDVTQAGVTDGSVPASATAATNGQAVTLSGYLNWLSGQGGTNNAVNTITFADGTAGATYVVFNDTSATNLLAVAKTGNFKSPALELSAGEGALVVFMATNAIYAIEK